MPTDPNPSSPSSRINTAGTANPDGLANDGAMTGAIADETADEAAERIIPPEQPPMDDAAGGPQAENPDAPVDDVPTEGGSAAADSAAHPS